MLEIGKKYTRDFSLFADRSDSIAFETYRRDPEAGADLYGWMQPGQRGFCEDYYSNYPQKGEMLNTFHIINTEYRYSEPMPEFHWQIQSSDVRNILGYECRKAVTTFRGRTWTAWYTTQIPVLNGPWKFNGLPGLILNAYDGDRYFEYTAVGIEKGSATPIFIYGNSEDATRYNQGEMKIINTTERKVKSLQALFWKDPIYLSELHGIKSYKRTKTGQTIAQKNGEMMLPYIPPLELE